MTQPIKLTIAEIEKILDCDPFTMPPGDWDLHKQLLDAMRENERLVERLDEIEYVAQCLKAECMIHAKDEKEMLRWAHDKIGNRLVELCDLDQPFFKMAVDGKHPNKHSVRYLRNEFTTDGKCLHHHDTNTQCPRCLREISLMHPPQNTDNCYYCFGTGVSPYEGYKALDPKLSKSISCPKCWGKLSKQSGVLPKKPEWVKDGEIVHLEHSKWRSDLNRVRFEGIECDAPTKTTEE